MSEVDRLSNSGLYPVLPIADQKRDKPKSGSAPPDPHGECDETTGPDSNSPRPPKSLIDEYA